MLQTHVRQHLDARVDHAGRVVAAAEPGLHDRHLDARPRQLPVGRRGERLELRDPVALPERAVDERGGLGRALHRGGEGLG